jgi:glutamate--cysteine ligase
MLSDVSGVDAILTALWQSRRAELEDWFAAREDAVKRLPYGSVDLRFSGDKRVPVDTNLFSGGFNNLDAEGQARAAEAFRRHFKRCCPKSQRLLIIPENHTRNQGYLNNLARLMDLVTRAGYAVALGRFDLAPGEHFMFTSEDGTACEAHGLRREGDRLFAGDFNPDVILLNHDLTTGVPELLNGLAQPVTPPPTLGWHQRRKSVHFEAYRALAKEFAEAFGLEPWRLSAEFERCGRINFGERSGLECVALNVEKVLRRLREQYAAHGITREPYVFVKADSGTYGMGIMTARSGNDVTEMNKKTRNKMDVIKEGAHSTDVIIQEGVPTLERVGDAFAEPVVYLVDHTPVGAFWRVNAERGEENNLNAAGMQFLPLPGEVPPAMAIVARLAMLAAAREEYEA